MNEEKALEYFGLTDKESAVYLALLSLGSSSVTAISTTAKIKRPTTYLILEDLRKKELVLKVPHAKKALYTAIEPDHFFHSKLSDFKEAFNALPKLKARHKSQSKISTSYFEGEDGIENALFYKKDELKDSEIVGFFAKGTKVSENLLNVSHEWRKEMKKHNVTLRGIAPQHETLEIFRKTDKDLDQVFRSVGIDEYSSDVSIDATNSFVRIVLFDSKQAIIIESPSVIKTVREIFEMVWKKLN